MQDGVLRGCQCRQCVWHWHYQLHSQSYTWRCDISASTLICYEELYYSYNAQIPLLTADFTFYVIIAALVAYTAYKWKFVVGARLSDVNLVEPPGTQVNVSI